MIWWAQTQIRGGFASLGSLGLGVRTKVCWRTWVMLFTCVELLLGRSYTGMYVYIYIYIYEFFYAKRFHESFSVRELYLLVDHVWL